MVHQRSKVSSNTKQNPTSYSTKISALNIQNLELPMRIKDIPKFERLNNLKIIVFELIGSVLSPVHIITNYTEPQSLIIV